MESIVIEINIFCHLQIPISGFAMKELLFVWQKDLLTNVVTGVMTTDLRGPILQYRGSRFD